MPSATDELIQRLYEAPPDGFVAARTAAINEARRVGDRESARRLAALKKPTVAAWVVNLLALRRPDLIEDLVGLSTAMREAQRGLDGGSERHGFVLRERGLRFLPEQRARQLDHRGHASGATDEQDLVDVGGAQTGVDESALNRLPHAVELRLPDGLRVGAAEVDLGPYLRQLHGARRA